MHAGPTSEATLGALDWNRSVLNFSAHCFQILSASRLTFGPASPLPNANLFVFRRADSASTDRPLGGVALTDTGHAALNRWFEIGIGASTGSAFGDTVSVSQASPEPE